MNKNTWRLFILAWNLKVFTETFQVFFFLFSFEHIASFMSVAFTAPTKFLLNRPIDSNNFLQKVSIIEMSLKNFHEIAG